MFITIKVIVLFILVGAFLVWTLWISANITKIDRNSSFKKSYSISNVMSRIYSLNDEINDENPRIIEGYDLSPWILNLNESKRISIDASYLHLKPCIHQNHDTDLSQLSLKKWYKKLPSLLHASKKRIRITKRMRMIQDYQMMNILGSGGFGSVRLAMLKTDPRKKYVIKRVPKHKIMPHRWMKLSKEIHDSDTNNQLAIFLPVEASVLLYVRSLPSSFERNLIVRLEEYLQDHDYYYLVFDWLPNAVDLTHVFADSSRTKSNYSSFFVVKRILFLIAQGVAFLHDHHIIHGDIKDENVLLYSKRKINFQNYNTIHVKLIDFGSCTYASKDDSSSLLMEYRGGSKYKSPEIVSGFFPFDGFKQDIWALGVLYYFILYHKFPFSNSVDVLSKTIDFPRNPFLTPELQHLLTIMLDKNSQTRPSIYAIINHPFFKRHESPNK